MKQTITRIFVENFGNKPSVIFLSLITCLIWTGFLAISFASI